MLGLIGEMDDLERVAVGVVEVGAAAGEHADVALLLAEHLDALGLELRYRGVESIAVDDESVMDDVGEALAPLLAAEDDIVGAGFEEHEVRVALRRLGDEFEAEHVGVEGAAAAEVADRNGDVQYAFGLD